MGNQRHPAAEPVSVAPSTAAAAAGSAASLDLRARWVPFWDFGQGPVLPAEVPAGAGGSAIASGLGTAAEPLPASSYFQTVRSSLQSWSHHHLLHAPLVDVASGVPRGCSYIAVGYSAESAGASPLTKTASRLVTAVAAVGAAVATSLLEGSGLQYCCHCDSGSFAAVAPAAVACS